MKNQQLIKQIEIKIKELQEKLEFWKQRIITHESALLTLTQQLQAIKNQIKPKK